MYRTVLRKSREGCEGSVVSDSTYSIIFDNILYNRHHAVQDLCSSLKLDNNSLVVRNSPRQTTSTVPFNHGKYTIL